MFAEYLRSLGFLLITDVVENNNLNSIAFTRGHPVSTPCWILPAGAQRLGDCSITHQELTLREGNDFISYRPFRREVIISHNYLEPPQPSSSNSNIHFLLYPLLFLFFSDIRHINTNCHFTQRIHVNTEVFALYNKNISNKNQCRPGFEF